MATACDADHLIVQLARENVAVEIIARAFALPDAMVSGVIDGAIRRRALERRPAPEGSEKVAHNRIVLELRQEIEELRRANKDGHKFDFDQLVVARLIAHGFTPKEARLLLLFKREPVSRETLYARMYSGGRVDVQIINAFVCRLRAKLSAHGVVINTLYGYGYQIENSCYGAFLRLTSQQGENRGKKRKDGCG